MIYKHIYSYIIIIIITTALEQLLFCQCTIVLFFRFIHLIVPSFLFILFNLAFLNMNNKPAQK